MSLQSQKLLLFDVSMDFFFSVCFVCELWNKLRGWRVFFDALLEEEKAGVVGELEELVGV